MRCLELSTTVDKLLGRYPLSVMGTLLNRVSLSQLPEMVVFANKVSKWQPGGRAKGEEHIFDDLA